MMDVYVTRAFINHRSTAAFANCYCCVRIMCTVHVLLLLPALSTARMTDCYILCVYLFVFFLKHFL